MYVLIQPNLLKHLNYLCLIFKIFKTLNLISLQFNYSNITISNRIVHGVKILYHLLYHKQFFSQKYLFYHDKKNFLRLQHT